jgi:hypothetical protein
MTHAINTTPVSFITGEVIYHHWDKKHRLVESTQAFHSLDELLAHCLAPPAKHLVNRVTVTGQDARGRRRQLVLSFQALTEP